MNDSGKVSRRFPTFFPISHDGAMAVVVGGGKRGDPNFWAATRWWQDRGMEVARGQLRPSLTLHSAFLHTGPVVVGYF